MRKMWLGAIVALGVAAGGAAAPTAQAAIVGQDTIEDVCVRHSVLEYPVRFCVVT